MPTFAEADSISLEELVTLITKTIPSLVTSFYVPCPDCKIALLHTAANPAKARITDYICCDYQATGTQRFQPRPSCDLADASFLLLMRYYNASLRLSGPAPELLSRVPTTEPERTAHSIYSMLSNLTEADSGAIESLRAELYDTVQDQPPCCSNNMVETRAFFVKIDGRHGGEYDSPITSTRQQESLERYVMDSVHAGTFPHVRRVLALANALRAELSIPTSIECVLHTNLFSITRFACSVRVLAAPLHTMICTVHHTSTCTLLSADGTLLQMLISRDARMLGTSYLASYEVGNLLGCV